MSKDEIDVQAVRAKFMQERERKLEKERGIEERDELATRVQNPPAVRGTDGGTPGTKERNPLEVAKELDAGTGSDTDDNGGDNGLPTMASKADEIKAYLDTLGVKYDGVTKKADLLALIPTE